MPFPSATLTSTQYDLLRGTSSVQSRYRVRAYVSVCPNDVVVAARVNGTPTGSSFASFAYDTVTNGAIANVQLGQTILISRTNNSRAAYFVGRIRELPSGSSSGTIYINETSAAIADNDYVFVIDDYRLWPILARDVSGVQYKDWDNTFASPPPFVSGVQTVYAGFVGTSGKLRIAFSASATAATSGASISSYAWTFGGVTSVISGATNTATVTVDFDPTPGVWNKLVVTDSGGRTTTRRFMVFAHNDTYLPAVGVDKIDLDTDVDSGISGTLTAFSGFESTLDNTLICVWVDEKYNSTAGSLLSGTNDARNIAFVGRLRTETNQNNIDERAVIVADVQFQLEDTAAQLRRLHGALIAEIIDASANEFDEIVNLTIWRGIVHLLGFHSTFLSLHDLTFDNTDNTYLCQGLRTQGENLFDVIADLASSINAAMEFAPDGSTRVIRSPYYKTTAERNAMTTLANMTDRDRWGKPAYTLTIDPVLKVGQVRSDGGMYFNLGSINQIYPLLAIAPGVAQDYAEGKSTLNRQVLAANVDIGTAKTELKQRIGRKFAEENIGTSLDMTLMDGWRWLVVSRGYWITHTIASNTNARGRAYTTADRWLVKHKTESFDIVGGMCAVTANFVPDINEDTLGASGDDLEYPDPETAIEPAIPALPPFDPYPIPDDVTPTDPPPIEGDPFNPTPLAKNGNVVVVWDDDDAWRTYNYLNANPTWAVITPGTNTIKACLFDPFPNSTNLWLLESDGTDSWVWYSPDMGDTWTQGATLSGVYTALRATDVSGGIMVYSPASDSGAWAHTFDFTASDGGFTPNSSMPDPSGTWSAGTGWVHTDQVYAPGPDLSRGVRIIKTFASAHITRLLMTYNVTRGSHILNGDLSASVTPPTAVVVWPTSNGTGLTLDSGVGSATTTTIALNVEADYHGVTARDGSATITSLRVEGDGPSPFGDSGGSSVAYSTNNGATWATQAVGLSPGSVGGFDTQRVGNVSIAAGDAQSYKAATKGGTYSSLSSDGATSGSDPILLELPWSQFGSAALDNFSTSTPDYFLGSAALVSSHCLWRVDGGGGRTGVTPTGATAMVSANCVSTYLGTRAAVIASVSGTRHLFTSTNLGSGDTWTDRGALGSNADFVRPLRLSKTLQHLFWVDGTTAKFSADYGATIASKNTPSTGTLRGIEVYG